MTEIANKSGATFIYLNKQKQSGHKLKKTNGHSKKKKLEIELKKF